MEKVDSSLSKQNLKSGKLKIYKIYSVLRGLKTRKANFCLFQIATEHIWTKYKKPFYLI